MRKLRRSRKCFLVFLALMTIALTGCGEKTGVLISETAESILNADDNENLKTLNKAVCDKLELSLLSPNEFSRPQEPLTEVKGIVVHYVANPGTTAQENRDYFESLAESGETYASSHFIIGLDGEILQLTPLDEIAYCSNERNVDTISIECCHPNDSGVYTKETYESLVNLTSLLCQYYGLEYGDVIRHFDVTGKLCPKAFALDPTYWYTFKSDVANALGENISPEELMETGTDAFFEGEEE